MSKLSSPPLALPFMSILYNESKVKEDEILKLVSDKFSDFLIFYHPHVPMKNYYSVEMGDENELKRLFCVSRVPIQRESFVSQKIWAVEMEKSYSESDKRWINLDPGFITHENLILATGKGYSHRIYMGSGVWSDLEYIYVNEGYRPLQWTYYDYRHQEVVDFFTKIRGLLFL